MAARKKPIPGKDDAQVMILKCPTCRIPLTVVNYRSGSLDHIRGIHRIDKYGWTGKCSECGQQWGSEEDPMIAPSLWVLSDLVGL